MESRSEISTHSEVRGSSAYERARPPPPPVKRASNKDPNGIPANGDGGGSSSPEAARRRSSSAASLRGLELPPPRRALHRERGHEEHEHHQNQEAHGATLPAPPTVRRRLGRCPARGLLRGLRGVDATVELPRGCEERGTCRAALRVRLPARADQVDVRPVCKDDVVAGVARLREPEATGAGNPCDTERLERAARALAVGLRVACDRRELVAGGCG